jgi:hypothetical protein
VGDILVNSNKDQTELDKLVETLGFDAGGEQWFRSELDLIINRRIDAVLDELISKSGEMSEVYIKGHRVGFRKVEAVPVSVIKQKKERLK